MKNPSIARARARARFAGRSTSPLLPILTLLMALAAVAAIACTDGAATEPQPAATAVPVATPPPSDPPVIPVAAQADVADFVSRRQDVNAQWDEMRNDFDQWSAGLDDCRPAAMQRALNGFAVSFNDVTRQAHGFTRSETAGELADLLIAAAEAEEASLRRLRDYWQPNNVSLFEDVAQSRADAARAQQSALGQAVALRAGFEDGLSSDSDTDADNGFALSLALVTTDWRQVHLDYNSLRKRTDDLSEASEELSDFADRMSAVVDALGELSDVPEGAEDAIKLLQKSAEYELETFQESAEAVAKEPDATDTDSSDAADSPDPDAIDASINESVTAMDDAEAAIENAGKTDTDDEIDPQQGLAELQTFRVEYNRLVRAWDAFHDDYNEWRGDEGGCDRVAVLQTLDQYSLRASRLARDVRALPSAGYLLPVYTLLTDAVAREENAIRSLRNTWQPFTLDAFRAVDRERVNADDLRRQADIAVQELQSRF